MGKPLYEDKQREGWYTLTLRLKQGEHDFIMDNWRRLYADADAGKPDDKNRDTGRDLLYMLLEFYLSNGTSSTVVGDPLERLRRRVDDTSDEIMQGIAMILDRIDDMPARAVIIDGDNQTVQADPVDNFGIIDDGLFNDLLEDFHDTTGTIGDDTE